MHSELSLTSIINCPGFIQQVVKFPERKSLFEQTAPKKLNYSDVKGYFACSD
jgi:hypothetical protein